jgi:transcriptional regulator of acetoin/glycerol metabolism
MARKVSEPLAAAHRGAGLPVGAEEIEAALRHANGNVAEAARRLGYSRQYLYRCIGALGIDPARFRAPGAPST